MLDTKALIAKVLNRLLSIESSTVHRRGIVFSTPALSAGAKGYWNITVSPAFPSSAIISIWPYSSRIAATSGLQLTPIYLDSGHLYVHYYAPNEVSAGNSITFYVAYFET